VAEPGVTIDEICAVACAEAFRGDGEILASAFGFVPTIGARLAKATFEPDLLISDGEALLVANPLPLAAGAEDKVVEGWMPFRTVFDMVWAGKRHAILGASQIDRFGNTNISSIGDWTRPKAQLIGVRGAPGNTINHPVSYWIPDHNPRVFVDHVDMVSGVGFDRDDRGPFHALRRVITNLCVLDFDTPDRSMRVRSLHPRVTEREVRDATGFEVAFADDLAESRAPTDEELRLIREVFDPTELRKRELRS
jgi:acyl CoA:acetate/3-ketoacid CoA transferase beta subunit